MQDTLRERARRQKETETSTRTNGDSWEAMFWRVVEAGQSWFVVSLVGESSRFLCGGRRWWEQGGGSWCS